MLEDDRSRPVYEIFEYIETVIDVGQIDFTRMFTDLKHILCSNGGHETVFRFDKGAVAKRQVAINELVECCFLVGIFAITYSPLIKAAVFLFDIPGTFTITSF